MHKSSSHAVQDPAPDGFHHVQLGYFFVLLPPIHVLQELNKVVDKRVLCFGSCRLLLIHFCGLVQIGSRKGLWVCAPDRKKETLHSPNLDRSYAYDYRDEFHHPLVSWPANRSGQVRQVGLIKKLVQLLPLWPRLFCFCFCSYVPCCLVTGTDRSLVYHIDPDD